MIDETFSRSGGMEKVPGGPGIAKGYPAMSRFFAVLALLGSLAASAQTSSILTAPFTIRMAADLTNATHLFGASSCNTTLVVQWSVTLFSGTPNGPMKLWATKGECGDAPAAGDHSFDDVPWPNWQAAKQGTFNLKPAELPVFSSSTTSDDAGTTGNVCGTGGVSLSNQICGAYPYMTSLYAGTNTWMRASPLKLVYDTLPPAAPVISNVTAMDGSARVFFSIDSDTVTVEVQVKGPDDADFLRRAEVTSSVSALSVTGLRNSVEYRIRLIASDAAGNVSEPSAEVTATPIKTVGFWGSYRAAGGTDQAGCSAVPAGMPFLALLLGAGVRNGCRRRRNR